MKILYKNSFTKELVNKWQSLSSREELRYIDNPKLAKQEAPSADISQKTVYTAPLGVEYKKKVADIRINKEVVEAEKLLKEYLYQKEFPTFVIQSSLKLSDDVKYIHELTKKNKIEFQQMMESFRKETEEKSSIFDRQVEQKIEILHQEILNMKQEQTKFCEDTDLKIEQVEKNTLWKIKDYEELLKTRPNKEFVRDTTKME